MGAQAYLLLLMMLYSAHSLHSKGFSTTTNIPSNTTSATPSRTASTTEILLASARMGVWTSPGQTFRPEFSNVTVNPLSETDLNSNHITNSTEAAASTKYETTAAYMNNNDSTESKVPTNIDVDTANSSENATQTTLDYNNTNRAISGKFIEIELKGRKDGLWTERLLGKQHALGIDRNGEFQENTQVEEEEEEAAVMQGTTEPKLTERDLRNIVSFNGMDIDQLKLYPIQAWSLIKESALKTLDNDDVLPLLDSIKTSGYTASWIRLLDILKDKLHLNNITSLMHLTSSQDILDKCVVRALSHYFGSPKDWQLYLVEGLGSSLLSIHISDIMKIRHPRAKQKILSFLEDTRGFRFQTFTLDEELLISKLVQDIFGPVESWDKVNSSLAKYIPYIPATQIMKLKPSVADEALSTLGGLRFPDRAHSQPIITKVIKHAALEKQVDTELRISLQRLIQKLGNLTTFLTVQDVDFLPRSSLQKDEILKGFSRNPYLTLEFGRYILETSKPRDGEWTIKDIQRLQPFLKYGGPQILLELASTRLMDQKTLRDLFKKTYVHYAIDRGQLQPVVNLAETLFKRNNRWDIASLPLAYLRVLTSEDIALLPAEDVGDAMAKLNVVADQLDILQTMAIVQKLLELGLKKLVHKSYLRPNAIFLDLMPSNAIDSLNVEEQMLLLQNIPEKSPHVIRYVENQWQKRKITLDDLRNDSILARSLTCEHLQHFPEKEIMELLVLIRMTHCSVSYTTTKCLAAKVKGYLEFLAENQIDDETELLSILKESELGIVGGDVLIHFSAESLQEQLPPSKCLLIFSLIGHLPLTTLNLLQPHEKKKQIARAALNCIDKQEDSLSISDMTVIGNLMGYLSEISIDKMPADIFASNLPYLLGRENFGNCPSEIEPKDFAIEPCLSLDMRTSIRRKLVNVFGLPETWGETEVRSIGCLISTLFLESLQAIKDEVLLSVADELNRCWSDNVQESYKNFGVYKSLCQKELLSGYTIIEDAKKQLKLRLKDAAVRSAQTTSKIRRAANPLTCQAIQKSGLNIMDVVSTEELESLSVEELKVCLETLGKFPMSRENALTLWRKVKLAFGKTASDMDMDTFGQMGYIVQGMNLTEISSLRLDNLDIISLFGAKRNYSLEQLNGLAVQVKTDYQSDASHYNQKDFLTFGYITCGFELSDIQKISPKLLTEISYQMRDQFSECRPETRNELAKKAVNGYGNPSNWTSAIVSSLGSLIGGLSLDELVLIPGRSFEKLPESSVTSIPLEAIKVLRPQQLGNFSIEAVSYLSQDQLSQLNPEQLETINEKKSLKNEGSSIVINVIWILSTITSLTLLF